MALQVETVALEYATPLPRLGAEHRVAFRAMLVLAVLSGFCVGICFLVLTEPRVFALPHLILFAATIAFAVNSAIQLKALGSAERGRTHLIHSLLDAGALVGLVVIGLAPLALNMDIDDSPMAPLALGLLALAYALLAVGSVRHLFLYRLLSGICRPIGYVKTGRNLIALGYFKTIYEGIWLACCAATLVWIGISQSHSLNINDDVTIALALASLIGAFGYGAVWIWMIVSHALLLRLASK